MRAFVCVCNSVSVRVHVHLSVSVSQCLCLRVLVLLPTHPSLIVRRKVSTTLGDLAMLISSSCGDSLKVLKGAKINSVTNGDERTWTGFASPGRDMLLE